LADRALRDESEMTGVAFQLSIVVWDSLTSNTDMTKCSLKQCAQKAITSADDRTQLQHLKSLEV
jgi:hypothetical protein